MKSEVINAFVDDLFGEQEGVVYAPTKGKRFYQHFFRWPAQRDKLIEHLSKKTEQEVYLSPILFKSPVVRPQSFKGTNYVWTEFDGNAPSEVPVPPSLIIQSSKPGYEHWYWRLNEFTTDPQKLTEVTKKLTYALGADLSAWDYATVLRPPDTYNHKRQTDVKLIEKNELSYDLESFSVLPDVPSKINIEVDRTKLPELKAIIAKYRWSDDAYELLSKSVEELNIREGRTTPDRSSALQRLAFECIEMGMSNDETFVVLEDADQRWKKFTDRTDRDKKLIAVISYARSKKARDAELPDEAPTIYRFKDFMNTKIKLKWVIPGLLPVAGSGLIFGASTLGKSTWALRMGMNIATGEKDFLEWPIERQLKVMFISLEMPHDELQYFMDQMKISDEQAEKLQENFFLWPIGHAYPFDVRDQQAEILKHIDETESKLIIIDSLGVSTYGSVNKQEDMKRLFSFLNEDVRKERGCGYFHVHHPRKHGVGDKKEQNADDLYGDAYIFNNAQTVIHLAHVSANKLKLSTLKARLSEGQQNFYIVRKPDRSFERVRHDDRKTTSKQETDDELLGDDPGIFSFGN